MPRGKAKKVQKRKNSSGKPMTKLREEVEREGIAQRLLDGNILAIDPSIGSSVSSMGYALYNAGELEDAGIVKMDPSFSNPQKLQEISRALIEDFAGTEIDILVIENIAPSFGGPGSRSFINKSWKVLHQATGAAIASVRCNHVLEVAPMSWKRFAKAEDGYEKNDVADAVMIGYTALWEAADHLNREAPTKHFIRLGDSE